MGLIKAAMQAVGSTLSDQYLEFFTCDSLGQETLVKKGARKMVRGSNKGDAEVITNGSKIAVPEGTALLLVDGGQVTDYTTEAGMYTWDASSAPSCFGSSGFLDGAKKSVIDLWQRIKAGGETPMQQRVYFVNMLEVIGNKFGTPAAIPYDDPTYRGIYVRVNGVFSFRIENPVSFFTNVSGNVSGDYTRSQLMEQAKTEFVGNLTNALNRMGDGGDGIRYNRLPSEITKLTGHMNEVLDEEWLAGRGMVVVSVGINSISPDDESRGRIQDFDRDIILSQNPNMLMARSIESNARAQVDAANNTAGAMTGLMGMGMVGGLGGGGFGGGGNLNAAWNQVGNPANPPAGAQAGTGAGAGVTAGAGAAYVASTPSGWQCGCGFNGNTGNFCAECGAPKPQNNGSWTCSCGAGGNTGKFCSQCGKPKQ
jgi:membrane protease subunit (stomatin/prohibitin family)